MMQTATTEIYDAIEALVVKYARKGIGRYQINTGWCDRFAAKLADMGFGTALWGTDLKRDVWGPKITDEVWEDQWVTVRDCGYHCFILFDGRYYDSESPDGVEWPEDLPCFQRYLDHGLEDE